MVRTLSTALLLLWATPAAAQIQIEEYTLGNGMTFLLYPRSDPQDEIAAGWVAHVGSVNERPGITGISHFFEHMMFKGTSTIGTNDPEKDAAFRDQQEAVRSELRALQQGPQYERWRKGEIADPFDPRNDTPEMAALRTRLKELMDAQKQVIVANEFDSIYRREGGTGMNAFTSEDVTFYFLTVPSNKLELWAWMESDRLTDPVFREFYSERDVVHEERRLRVDSTPTGAFDEQLEGMFWSSSSYRWPVIGYPSDLESYTLDQARDYFGTYYAPNNLTGVIVGDFDPAVVKPMLETYFGHLPKGPEAPAVVTLEIPQLAERRMSAECDCSPQTTVMYHGVAAGHPDETVLEVIADLLNGNTGRLYKALVEGKELATGAGARPDIRKYAGGFQVYLQGREGVDPDQLEAAWYDELARLQDEAVPERELQKVKNAFAADQYRQMRSNYFLMVTLGYSEVLSGWESINERPKRYAAVTAEDVARVAKKYFEPANRTVGQYRRQEGSAPDPELTKALEGLPEQVAQGLRAQLAALKAESDAAELTAAVKQMTAQKAQVPPPMRPAFEYLLQKANERLAELQGGK